MREQVGLLQRLERIMPSSLTTHFFCNSGAGKEAAVQGKPAERRSLVRVRGRTPFVQCPCPILRPQLQLAWPAMLRASALLLTPAVPSPRQLRTARLGASPSNRHFGLVPAEAVENAVKIARNYTGRQNIISFDASTALPVLGHPL